MSTTINKFLVALVGFILMLANNYGWNIDPQMETTLNALIPGITAALVWWIPNRPHSQ